MLYAKKANIIEILHLVGLEKVDKKLISINGTNHYYNIYLNQKKYSVYKMKLNSNDGTIKCASTTKSQKMIIMLLNVRVGNMY